MVGSTLKDVILYNCNYEELKQDAKFSAIITSEQLNDTDCYFVQFNGIKIWINKDNGLPLKYISENNMVTYSYEFGNVTSSNIVKPDISDFN